MKRMAERDFETPAQAQAQAVAARRSDAMETLPHRPMPKVRPRGSVATAGPTPPTSQPPAHLFADAGKSKGKGSDDWSGKGKGSHYDRSGKGSKGHVDWSGKGSKGHDDWSGKGGHYDRSGKGSRDDWSGKGSHDDWSRKGSKGQSSYKGKTDKGFKSKSSGHRYQPW